MAHNDNAAVIRLDRIQIDGGTQSRAALNEAVVADYAEHVDSLPPVTVYFDGAAYWLADGFHRYFAHKKAGRDVLRAIVERGTKRDAILHSVGANATHGLRRTNEDKRRAVLTLLEDAEWATWSDRDIAKACGVTHPFVASIRRPEARQERDARRAEVVTVTTRRAAPDEGGPDKTAVAASPRPAPAPPPPPPERDVRGLPVEADDDGMTPAEMLAMLTELQAENERLLSEITVAQAADPVAEALKWRRLYDNAVRQQSEAMDSAKRSLDREKWTHRQLMRCGKAVGETDPTKIAPKVEALARERRAA